MDTLFPKPQGLYHPRFEKDSCGVGFVCDMHGKQTHEIIKKALEILCRLSHRGATGADPKTGDGAGILIQMPHAFFAKVCAQQKMSLPAQGQYGTGLIFLPVHKEARQYCKQIIEEAVRRYDQTVLGWRAIPVTSTHIGETAQKTEPVMEQVFIQQKTQQTDSLAFERSLYLIRKYAENTIRSADIKEKTFFYITSLSSRTFIYKGLLMPDQVEKFFNDLQDPDMASALALVHSRYSTNTFPTWDLAQPFRFLAHNGEINTLQGNIHWMRAREGTMQSTLFGNAMQDIRPVLVPGQSDSATLDNAFELLMLAGRSLPHAMMMLIPQAWEQNASLSKEMKSFYQYHACIMEPWDGPAAIAFTDGTCVGAVLDRNGLRPARYIVTTDGLVIMASEVGVLDVPAENIRVTGRLEPGKIFFIDTLQKTIVHDPEIKNELIKAKPYAQWIDTHMISLEDIPAGREKIFSPSAEELTRLLKAFGYTREDIKYIVKPMADEGIEPTGSMGNDTPHAVLSQRPQLLYSYFKQLFAQVTNPAIDPIREEIVMSLDSFLGPSSNLFDELPQHCHKLHVKKPILTDEELRTIRHIQDNGFKTKTISLLFKVSEEQSFMATIDRICREAESAIQEGYSFLILSDRGVNKDYAALPALLAVGTLHHALVAKALRTQISIILETAEPREVHHFALLFGYGADCINPYLVYDLLMSLVQEGQIAGTYSTAIDHYRKAVHKGILKILSKMGISTLQSYRGAQIFEALGVHQSVIDRCFAGSISRIGGVDFAIIRQETLMRHQDAYPSSPYKETPYLSSGGIYQYKKDGEFHLWNPETIALLQDSVRMNDYGKYKEFAKHINDQSAQPVTLRSLFRFKKQISISVDQVESETSIIKRFATGAMSFGSISRAAHETLAIAMNRLGGRSNTGEGGEDPQRFFPLPHGDSRRSAIKQVASGRFGVTTYYLVNADELQIKIAQGAKPGEGGQLPGHKVSATIAATRYTTAGVTLISPPPHHDIYSIEDLAQLIFDLKNVNPQARISVKLVSEPGVGTIAAGVAKGHADMILISGGDGGTGASPLSSIKHAGLPWELGLSETHQTLLLNDLRSRVRVQTDGQMRTGRDVAIAALLGAEEYGFCTAALIVMGCVMLRHCHLNNCAVGIATQNELLERRFRGNVDYVINYIRFVVQELREIMAQLGIKSVDAMIGRTDMIELDRNILPWKATQLDLSKILYKPKVPAHVSAYCTTSQDHGLDHILDRELIKKSHAALLHKERVHIAMPIQNIHRTTGAMLSGEIAKQHREEGLPDDTVTCTFHGTAGQSFGAFLMSGVTFILKGMANDYVGKGMFGGKLIVMPDEKAQYCAQENSIIGNTTFYGAIRGQAYICGKAGERFCIRNSGLYAVVEGVGDHGCEYMTGGRVVVLGPTGRNFAAGMSGGIAYVYDQDHSFPSRCNKEMVVLESLEETDIQTLYQMIHLHYTYTKSARAKELIDSFPQSREVFVKVMPLEYKRILQAQKMEKELGLGEVSD